MPDPAPVDRDARVAELEAELAALKTVSTPEPEPLPGPSAAPGVMPADSPAGPVPAEPGTAGSMYAASLDPVELLGSAQADEPAQNFGGLSDHANPGHRPYLPELSEPEPQAHPAAGVPGLGKGVSN